MIWFASAVATSCVALAISTWKFVKQDVRWKTLWTQPEKSYSSDLQETLSVCQTRACIICDCNVCCMYCNVIKREFMAHAKPTWKVAGRKSELCNDTEPPCHILKLHTQREKCARSRVYATGSDTDSTTLIHCASNQTKIEYDLIQILSESFGSCICILATSLSRSMCVCDTHGTFDSLFLHHFIIF